MNVAAVERSVNEYHEEIRSADHVLPAGLPDDPHAQQHRHHSAVVATAGHFHARGFPVCRLRPGEKNPLDTEWTVKDYKPDDFPSGFGVGLITGFRPGLIARPGCSLVCADIDREDHGDRLRALLPKTGMVDGRESNPDSHPWFWVRNDSIPPEYVASSPTAASVQLAKELGTHPGPRKVRFVGPDGKSVFELLGTGQQAAIPPTVNVSKKTGKVELRTWSAAVGENGVEVEPAEVDFMDLVRAGRTLADEIGGREEGVKTPEVAKPKRSGPGYTAADSPAADTPAADAPAATTGDEAAWEAEHCAGWEAREAKARNYLHPLLADQGLMRSGENGHGRLFNLASLLMIDFALPRGVARQILVEMVNEPLKAVPGPDGKPVDDSWSESELDHKLDDVAAKRRTAPNLGCKRQAAGAGGNDGAPRKWDDPAAIAEKLLRDHVYRFLRDTAHEYEGGVYRAASEKHLRARVRAVFDREAAADYKRRSERWEADGYGRELGERRAEREELEAQMKKCEKDDAAKLAARLERVDRQIERAEKGRPKALREYSAKLITDAIDAAATASQLPDRTEYDSWLDGRAAPPVLSLPNGLLQVERGRLTPHDPAWFSTVQLPVPFDPAALPPAKWLVFLAEVLEADAERIAIVQEVFGACLLPHVPGKFFALFVGEGNNGKSVAANVLSFLLGEDNTAAMTLDRLSASNFAAATLAGKLANVVGDQGSLELKDLGWLKTLTGGDKVAAEKKGKDAVFVRNTAKIVAACNEPPKFGDRSEATWNRLVMVPFRVVVAADRINPAMLTAGYWRAELPAILSWAVAGAQRWLASGTRFTRSAVCDEAKGDHRRDSNPARDYLLDGYEAGGGFVAAKALYDGYRQRMDANGYRHPLTAKGFGLEVMRAFPTAKAERQTIDGQRQRGFVGISQREE